MRIIIWLCFSTAGASYNCGELRGEDGAVEDDLVSGFISEDFAALVQNPFRPVWRFVLVECGYGW